MRRACLRGARNRVYPANNSLGVSRPVIWPLSSPGGSMAIFMPEAAQLVRLLKTRFSRGRLLSSAGICENKYIWYTNNQRELRQVHTICIHIHFLSGLVSSHLRFPNHHLHCLRLPGSRGGHFSQKSCDQHHQSQSPWLICYRLLTSRPSSQN